MTYEYFWDPGKPLAGLLKHIDPDKFGTSLTQLETKHGKVTASLLADAAKAKKHPAHAFVYHVDEGQAAQLHYEERARLLLRSFRVRPVEQPSVNVRARIAVPSDADGSGDGEGAHYLSAQEVAARPDLRDLHRKSLLRRMNLLRLELISFDEFAEVVGAIERVLEDAAA